MPSYPDATGLIFNIQKYSVHDGPGIRTIVFFKGCPLRCRWCSNPESQCMKYELGYNRDKCLACGTCVRICPEDALTLSPEGVNIDRTRCSMDQLCSRACPAEALTVYGTRRSVEDILNDVEQDSVFYARSGGGMTLSGGEPLAQPEFALALLSEARKRRIHRALETCAFVPEETMLRAAELLNYLLIDIKCMDSEKHRNGTGVPNDRILSNIRAVRAAFPSLPIHIRTPVVPGFNDNDEDIRAIAEFVRESGCARYEPLAYHRLGTQKYRFLGLDYPLGDKELSEERFERLRQIAASLCPAPHGEGAA